MTELETRKKNFSKNILENKWTYLFLLIFIFAIIIRFYFVLTYQNQAVWWDEADYLTEAKIFGGKLSAEYLNFEWNARRPFLLSILWGGIYRLGGDEFAIRFTELLFSIASVLLTYLISKEMFNKKVGLIAAFAMTVYWDSLFSTARTLTELPATTFWLLTVLFFWKGYIKKQNSKYIWLSGIFLGLTFLTRAATTLLIIPIILFLALTTKLKFLTNKHLWIALVATFVTFSPFIFFIQSKFNVNFFQAIWKFTGIGEGRFSEAAVVSGPFKYIGQFNQLFFPIFLILMIIGLYILIEMFLGFDLIIKGKEEKLQKYLFLFLWILIPLIFFSSTTAYMESRYIINTMPAFFIIMALGTLKVHDWISKYNKIAAIIIIICLLLIGSYQQLNHANFIIKNKSTSYYPVKQAGLWLKANTEPSDTIISESYYQNIYYSERKTNFFSPKNTTQDLENLIKTENPSHLIVSVFEPAFTPQWFFTYPQEYPEKFKVVQAYFADPQKTQPLLIIYKIN